MSRAVAVLCASAACAAAEVLGPFEIFPGGAPFEHGDAEHETVTNTSEGRLIKNVTVPTVTVYTPDGPGPHPAMVVLPGGGYEHLYWDKEGVAAAEWLSGIGVVAAVLKYRVPLRLPRPSLPGLHGAVDVAAEIWRPLMDVQRAVGIVRANASQWGVNTSAVGVGGFSAGGSLSAALATHWRERLYAARDAADAQPCRPDFVMMAYPAPLSASPLALKTTLLPGLDVDKETPPAFLAQAADDGFGAENSIAWWLGMRRAGGPPAELNVYPSGGHGFGLCSDAGTEVCGWTARAERWLRLTARVLPN